MSQGEKSCKMFGNCTEFTEIKKCNKDCGFYNSKNEDISKEVDQAAEEELKKEEEDKPIIQLSTLPKFDKMHEFVVLKNHVFFMQNVSPKKIILKYKRKLGKKDTLPDGCYVFKDKNDNLIEHAKIFGKLDKNIRAARRTNDKKIRAAKKEKTK